MSDRTALPALERKRAELASELTEVEARAHWLRETIEHLDATMLVFQPGVNPKAIRPQVRSNGYRLFKFGYLSRFILGTLRERGPLDTDAMTLAVMHDAGLNAGDDLVRSSVRRRVAYALRDQRQNGRLAQTGRLWRLAE